MLRSRSQPVFLIRTYRTGGATTCGVGVRKPSIEHFEYRFEEAKP